jgi:hypothetical protein
VSQAPKSSSQPVAARCRGTPKLGRVETICSATIRSSTRSTGGQDRCSPTSKPSSVHSAQCCGIKARQTYSCADTGAKRPATAKLANSWALPGRLQATTKVASRLLAAAKMPTPTRTVAQPEAEACTSDNRQRPRPHAEANAATPFVGRFASVVDWMRRGLWHYHCSWLAVCHVVRVIYNVTHTACGFVVLLSGSVLL